jgi:hypothetical protein
MPRERATPETETRNPDSRDLVEDNPRTREHVHRDLHKASQLISDEMSSDRKDARKTRRARRQARRGKLLSDIDE